MRKIVKKYTEIFTCDEDGKLYSERENNGFNAFEILGMLEKTKMQIVEMMIGKIDIPIEHTKISIVDKERITIDHVIKNCEVCPKFAILFCLFKDKYKYSINQ